MKIDKEKQEKNLPLGGLILSVKTPAFSSFIRELDKLFLKVPVGYKADFYGESSDRGLFQTIARSLESAYHNQSIMEFEKAIKSMHSWKLFTTPPNNWDSDKRSIYTGLHYFIEEMRKELITVQEEASKIVVRIKNELNSIH